MNASIDPIPTVSHLELGLSQFYRFVGFDGDEPIEVATIDHRKRIMVAYPRGYQQLLQTVRWAERVKDSSGVYIVPNRINPAIAARYPEQGIHRAERGRAKDKEIEARRVVFIDIDAERPDGISATDDEKRLVYAVADELEDYIAQAIGGDGAIGRGDSGNGLALFVAIEERPVCNDETKRLSQLMSVFNQKFSRPGAKVDLSVFNASRLVPCFGTVKSKGADTKERPHRQTYFSCRHPHHRVPLEALV